MWRTRVHSIIGSTGWTQARLAKEVGVTVATIKWWLRGSAVPTMRSASRRKLEVVELRVFGGRCPHCGSHVVGSANSGRPLDGAWWV